VLVVEACLSADTDAALLYPRNLTGAFFDLSSGGRFFGLFDTRAQAVQWLARPPQPGTGEE
jgi:hypothetical protein